MNSGECVPSYNKLRCICMQLNREDYIFNRVQMSCSLTYCCLLRMRLGRARLCIIKSSPQERTCCERWNASELLRKFEAIQRRGDSQLQTDDPQRTQHLSEVGLEVFTVWQQLSVWIFTLYKNKISNKKNIGLYWFVDLWPTATKN